MLMLGVVVAFGIGQDAYPAYAVSRLSGFTIKGLPAVTGHICVDQFGYPPASGKFAIISDPQVGFNASDHYTPGTTLQVRTRSGKTVLSGAAVVWNGGATHADSGDRGWWFDFSTLTTPGEYYVFDPSTNLRSPLFRIRETVYKPVLVAATRMYYYQRLGTPLEAKYSQGPWVDGPAYLQDKRMRSVEHKNDPSFERDMSGGWMDAGDTDKYPPFNADVIHPLLYAYTANPKAFTDDFGIPESGNGIPDLLDEVKVQLDWLVRCQFPDGSLPVKMGQIDYGGKQPLSADTRPRYYGPKDSGATIYTAANFAHAARVYAKFPQFAAYAKDLEARALKAWNWYQTNPRTFKTDTGEIKSGIANRSAEEQDRMEAYAAIHLFALTGDSKYQQNIRKKIRASRQISGGLWSEYEVGASEALVEYAEMKGADPELAKMIRTKLGQSAGNPQFAPSPEADLYRAWMRPTSYHWGSSTVRASWGMVALLAARAGGVDAKEKARLRQRAADMLHSFHGVNPLSVVYLTNMGKYGAENSLHEMYHERYGAGTAWSHNPPPGYVVGGPNASYTGKAAAGKPSTDWIRAQPRGKAYADTNLGWPESSWELSEPAIYYQAIYIRLLSEFAK